MASHDAPIAYEWLVRIAIAVAGVFSTVATAYFIFRGKQSEISIAARQAEASHEQKSRAMTLTERAAIFNDQRALIKDLQADAVNDKARIRALESQMERLEKKEDG